MTIRQWCNETAFSDPVFILIHLRLVIESIRKTQHWKLSFSEVSTCAIVRRKKEETWKFEIKVHKLENLSDAYTNTNQICLKQKSKKFADKNAFDKQICTKASGTLDCYVRVTFTEIAHWNMRFEFFAKFNQFWYRYGESKMWQIVHTAEAVAIRSNFPSLFRHFAFWKYHTYLFFIVVEIFCSCVMRILLVYHSVGCWFR